jgi:hypothetical protein
VSAAERGKGTFMDEQRSASERTETDERVAENQAAAPIASVTRDPDSDVDPATGLPRGMHDDDSSPLDLNDPIEE